MNDLLAFTTKKLTGNNVNLDLILDLQKDVDELIKKKKKELDLEAMKYISTIKAVNDTSSVLEDKLINIRVELQDYFLKMNHPKDGPCVRLNELNAELENLQLDVKSDEELIKILKDICQCNSLLKKFDEIMNNDDLDNACTMISHVEKESILLNSLQEAKIIKKLFENIAIRKRKIIEAIINNFNKSISIKGSSILVIHQKETLVNTFNAIQSLKVYKEVLDSFIAQIREIVLPTLLSKNDCNIEIESKKIDGVSSSFNVSCSSSSPNGLLKPLILYDRLIQLFSFLFDHVFEQNKSIMSYLSSILWTNEIGKDDDLTSKLIQSLQINIPKSAESLIEYQNVVKATEELENKFQSMGLVEINVTPSKLMSFVNNIDSFFAESKRSLALTNVQSIIVNSRKTQLITEKESLSFIERNRISFSFNFPQAVVSESVVKLIEVVHELMQEATMTTPRCSVVLYGTARDVINMYRAIIPFTQEENIRNITSVKWIFFNDSPPLNSCGNLLDLYYTYLDMANSIFDDEIESQRKKISSIFSSSSIVPSLLRIPSGVDAAEKGIASMISHIKSLFEDMILICSRSTIVHFFSVIINSFLEEILQYIQSKQIIGEEESLSLFDLFSSLSNGIITMLNEVSVKHPNQSLHPFPINKIASWDTFVTMTSVLNSKLADISNRVDVEFYSALDSKFLRNLILALFSDSKKRQELIQKLY